MDSFEFNKIFAAILIAAITAMLGGFIAEQLMHPHDLKTNAVEIDGEPVVAGAAEMGDPTEQDLVMSMLAEADIARGQKLSKACAACHSFDQGGVNKVGPNLWNVVNAQKGHHSSFAYSDALMAHGGTWDFAELNGFLYKPKKHINGTKMNYIGIKKPKDRAAMLVWLNTLSDSPAALPEVIVKDDISNSPTDGGAEPNANASDVLDAVDTDVQTTITSGTAETIVPVEVPQSDTPAVNMNDEDRTATY